MTQETDIAARVAAVREELRQIALKAGRDPKEIRLLAAAKEQSAENVRQALAAGVDAVGENRVQEMLAKEKAGAYTAGELHFIGRLQKNKIKDVAGRVRLIHSVEDETQAAMIGRYAEAQGVIQDVLVQVNIGMEPTKSGFLPKEAEKAVIRIDKIEFLRVRGLMCIPPPIQRMEESQVYYEQMQKLYVDMRKRIQDNRCVNSVEGDFSLLSMGMSQDYQMAVMHGSTMVRVGNAIFGPRRMLVTG